MLGLFGNFVIGHDHLTGPVGDSQDMAARFARHETVRGTPILQDLGNDNGTRQLRFFFDETFCNPEAEARRFEQAFKARTPMRLFFDVVGFEIGSFLIERIRKVTRKTAPSGRVTRIEIEVELIESASSIGGLLGAAVGLARAILNPLVQR